MDFALVEVVDIDVVVVIRFVAMEIILKERLTQRKPEAKSKFDFDKVDKGRRRGVQKIPQLEVVPKSGSRATSQVPREARITSTPLMAWIPTAPWQFRVAASEGSCFTDQPHCAASPQASHRAISGPSPSLRIRARELGRRAGLRGLGLYSLTQGLP